MEIAFFILLGFSVISTIAFFIMRSARNEAERLSNSLRKDLFEVKESLQKTDQAYKKLQKEHLELQTQYYYHIENLDKLLESNLTAIPWLAGMVADFYTYDIEVEAKKLDWGHNIQREKKVASIRAIRADAQRRIEEAKIATYQLAYLKELYPALSDLLETDFSDLELTGTIPDQDPVRGWLSKEEWHSLPVDARNQLALDRYIQSHRKSKWQIGRDYELAVSYEFSKAGYSVHNTGSLLKLEDLGRDIIAIKGDRVYIIQCKYWSESKEIHEKHIMQLYGTSVLYSLEHPFFEGKVTPVFVTNIALSVKASQVAKALKIVVYEKHPFSEFPRIKCNIGKDESGAATHIYHLPMDDQYDNVKLDKPGECLVYTVEEAVKKGFRRAYKWHGES